MEHCELCTRDGGEVVWQGYKLRVVLANEKGHPGFCRVIWNEHMAEMTDLPLSGRSQLMDAVWQVEAALRSVMSPRKINLASLGNAVPHVHWHVIPRYDDDAQFPGAVWAKARRKPSPEALAAREELLPALRAEIVRRMKGGRD
jgi:diadenosine tetraphosphate (Ap4A) HIT family hydrolase